MLKTQYSTLLLVWLMMTFGLSTATAATLPQAGTVIMTSGQVTAVGSDQENRTLSRRATVYVGDRLKTSSDAQVQLRMKDGAMISIGPESEFFIGAYSDDATGDKKDGAVLKLMQGGLRTITGSIDKASYRLETPVATLGIRGTVFDVFVKGDGTTTVVLRDGAVDVTGESGVVQKLDLPGLAVVVSAGKPPSKPGPVPPDMLNYLRQFIPDVSDDVTWQINEDGSTTINIGDDILNIINTPPPGTTEDGSVPGNQEQAPVPEPELPVDEQCVECYYDYGAGAEMINDYSLVAKMPDQAAEIQAALESGTFAE